MSTLTGIVVRYFRNVQRLFHMLVGLAFLFLSIAGAAVAYQEWKYYTQAPALGLTRFALLAGFTVLLFIFGLYSFAKARSVR